MSSAAFHFAVYSLSFCITSRPNASPSGSVSFLPVIANTHSQSPA